MIHMWSSDFHSSRLASTSKEVEIMVLHRTQGWHIHQGSKLIYFQFLLFLTSWRELCGLSAVKSWKMLAKIFPENIVPRLQAIYDKVGSQLNTSPPIKPQKSPHEKSQKSQYENLSQGGRCRSLCGWFARVCWRGLIFYNFPKRSRNAAKLLRVFLDQPFSAWLVTSSKGLKLVIGMCRLSSSDFNRVVSSWVVV